MLPLSSAAAAALRGSHAITSRATAYTPVGRMPNIPVSEAVVTSDATSQVRRTADVKVSPRGGTTLGGQDMWPASPLSPLSPVGSELAIDFGIVIPGQDEPEWLRIIRGPIQSVKDSVNGSPLQVAVSDPSAGVAQARLLTPGQTVQDATYVAEITRLITEAQPDAVVLDQTGNTAVCPVTDIAAERWKDGVEKLADAIGAEVYARPDGVTYLIRPVPTLDDPPVWLIDAGRGGVLVKASREVTREGVYNAVTASGARTDGAPTVTATVVDDDPASPTVYGGPFGQKVRYYSSPFLTTVEQCQTAAAALLARAKGYVATVSVETITNPALEGGDVVLVKMPDGQIQTHIIDSVPISNRADATQALTTRSIDVLPSESEQ